MNGPGQTGTAPGGRVLRLLAPKFTVWKASSDTQIPSWSGGAFWSVTRTRQEVSVIAESDFMPNAVAGSSDWRCLEVEGPIPHDAVGVLASLVDPLRQAGVPILAHSTHDTDYLFVPADRVERAMKALVSAGHTIFADASRVSLERNP